MVPSKLKAIMYEAVLPFVSSDFRATIILSKELGTNLKLENPWVAMTSPIRFV